jgi:hypothetical protein
VETFIDPQRFRGTCYRAANWTLMGVTTGRGKDAPTHEPNRSIKQVLGYPLVKNFRSRLCELTTKAPRPRPPSPAASPKLADLEIRATDRLAFPTQSEMDFNEE